MQRRLASAKPLPWYCHREESAQRIATGLAAANDLDAEFNFREIDSLSDPHRIDASLKTEVQAQIRLEISERCCRRPSLGLRVELSASKSDD